MIRDLSDFVAGAIRAVATASWAMLLVRLLLALSCCGVLVLLGWLPPFVEVPLVVLAVLAVLVPDSPFVVSFLVLALVCWWATGVRPAGQVVALVTAFGAVHALATFAARGPLQAAVRRSGLAIRGWAGWLAASGAAAGLVVGIGLVPASVLPRGTIVVVAAAAVAVLAVIGALLLARRSPDA